jgi:predicted transposase YdaD
MMIGTFFPGRGTMIEKAFLEGEAKGKAEGEAKGKAEGEAKGKAEGEARGKAELIMRVLQRRDIPITSDAVQKITECQDLAKLDSWFDRALTATRVEDLFTHSVD